MAEDLGGGRAGSVDEGHNVSAVDASRDRPSWATKRFVMRNDKVLRLQVSLADGNQCKGIHSRCVLPRPVAHGVLFEDGLPLYEKGLKLPEPGDPKMCRRRCGWR